MLIPHTGNVGSSKRGPGSLQFGEIKTVLDGTTFQNNGWQLGGYRLDKAFSPPHAPPVVVCLLSTCCLWVSRYENDAECMFPAAL